MSVCYLEVEDEITDAVARLRSAPDDRVVVVVPPGSRIGTSRINFRLLQREADKERRGLVFVSSDAAVRALATSAGLEAHATVADAEQGMAVGSTLSATGPTSAPTGPAPATPGPTSATAGPATHRDSAQANATTPGSTPHPETAPPSEAPPGQAAPTHPRPRDHRWAASPRGTVARPRSAGEVVRSPTGGFATTPRTTSAALEITHGPESVWTGDTGAAPAKPARRGRSRTRRLVGWAIRLAIVVALIGGAGYAGYVYLPTATITLTPGTQELGPMQITVTADPSVAVADPDQRQVPAEHVPIPLSASGTFPATGQQVNQSRATGTVTFTSTNTFFDVPIPEGTVVSTKAGVAFQTTAATVLPKADINHPSSVDVAIRAASPGPGGNVAAGTITSAPDAITTLLVSVTNADPTTGGRRIVTTIVTHDDYDAAVTDLTAQLGTELQDLLADPSTAPRGLTVFPQTGTMGKVTVAQSASDVVGAATESFQISVESPGSVLAVDEALVASVAGNQLLASVAPGVRVFPETVTTQVSPGVVNGDVITYQVTADGRQYAPIDASALEDSIRGKTISEARSILEPYGTVELSVWPDFIPTIPDDVRRINLTIESPELPR
jgi:Baseplate J-like protein